MPVARFEMPDGRIGRFEVPDGTTSEQAKAMIAAQVRPARQPDALDDPNMAANVPWYENLAAGAGKAVADIGLGARQLVGRASQEEVDAAKARDAPLMSTGWGMGGNVAGNVAAAVLPGLGMAGTGAALGKGGLQAAGKYLLSSPSTLGGLATQGSLGATQGLIQPTATGEDRLTNTTIGAAAGGAIPALGMAFKGAKAAVEPLYAGGQGAILARAMRGATGPNADAVAGRLANAQTLVPGSAPTAAEVGQSGGLAALQRAASAVDPESYANRGIQQNEARVALLRDMAGTSGARNAAVTARDAVADPLYAQARSVGVDPSMAKMLEPQINNLIERAPSGVLEKAKELARVKGDVIDSTGSITGLHYLKKAVDDILDTAPQTGVGKQMNSAVTQYKNDLLTVIDDLSPLYAQGRQAFQQASKPINQMDTAQAIANKAIRPLDDTMQPAAYARAMSDDTAASATGFRKATLENTMEPDQLAKLNAIKADLARGVFARDAGRGAGSDTVQKLAMTNLLKQSGIPEAAINFYGMGTIGKMLYSNADDTMKGKLAAALLNPAEAGRIMQSGAPNVRLQKMIEAMRVGANPLLIGGATGALDARQ